MNKFDWQVLEVLHILYAEGLTELLEDLDISFQGQTRFDDSWGGEVKEGKNYRYAPLISLSLGRLQKAGLVTRNCAKKSSFGRWSLTEEGRKQAGQLRGEY